MNDVDKPFHAKGSRMAETSKDTLGADATTEHSPREQIQSAKTEGQRSNKPKQSSWATLLIILLWVLIQPKLCGHRSSDIDSTELESTFDETFGALAAVEPDVHEALKDCFIGYVTGKDWQPALLRAKRTVDSTIKVYLPISTNTAVRSLAEAYWSLMNEFCSRDISLCYRCSQGNCDIKRGELGKIRENETKKVVALYEAISNVILAAKKTPQDRPNESECLTLNNVIEQLAAEALGKDMLILGEEPSPNIDKTAYMDALRRFHELIWKLPPEMGGKMYRCMLAG